MILNSTDFSTKYWQLAHGKSIKLGPCSVLMGILNVTPDSFSDGALINNVSDALNAAEILVAQGANILDVGGESTRPGSNPVSEQLEQDRVLPVISALKANFDTILSIDTYRAHTADLALSAGAHIINDVWGLQKDTQIAAIAAKHAAGVCIMHNGRDRVKHDDVIKDQYKWFERSLDIAKTAGMEASQIVLDPGFGFAKETTEENLALMLRFQELLDLGYPIMAGTSRKRFIGALTGKDATDRDVGTAATSVLLRQLGASIFRVHNVGTNADALAVIDGLIQHQISQTGPDHG